MTAQFTGQGKFALLAVDGIDTNFPDEQDYEHQLSDGTRVCVRMPVAIGSSWGKWIGTIRLERLKNSSLVMIVCENSVNPDLLDNHHDKLKRRLWQTFSLLQLSGVLGYEGSNFLCGSFCDGKSEVRQMSELPLFCQISGVEAVGRPLAIPVECPGFAGAHPVPLRHVQRPRFALRLGPTTPVETRCADPTLKWLDALLPGYRGLLGSRVAPCLLDGCARLPVTIERLEKAVQLRNAVAEIESDAESFTRLKWGWRVLVDGLQKRQGEERIHQLVRSLEALIVPEVGQTKKQFVHRCQRLARASNNTKTILEEAFALRSMAEHLNAWEQALKSHPENDRENVALHRTRQMEQLATFAYSRIFESNAVRNYFINEAKQKEFWNLLDDKRRSIWGTPLDLDDKMPTLRHNSVNEPFQEPTWN